MGTSLKNYTIIRTLPNGRKQWHGRYDWTSVGSRAAKLWTLRGAERALTRFRAAYPEAEYAIQQQWWR